MNRPNPIVIRPRKGSALAEVWDGEGHDVTAMKEIVHSWAESFKLMAQQENEEITDD